MASTYAPPEKEYLPPKEVPHPHYEASMRPPSKDYIPPSTTVHPPSHHSYQSTILPPTKGYLPPKGYKAVDAGPNYSTMVPPKKDYLAPDPHPAAPHYHSTTMKPPVKNYIPPEHPHGHHDHPVKHEMALYQPPSHEYITPVSEFYPKKPSTHLEHHHHHHHMSTTIAPPSKDYLPPAVGYSTTIKPVHHKGHLEVSTVKQVPGYNHYSTTFKPPVKSYLPPAKPTALPPPPTPNREYVSPLGKEHPAGHYKEPEPHHPIVPAAALPPHKPHPHPKHLLPAVPGGKDLTLCPHFKETLHCIPHHECWSPGVPDEDCPHNGFCCFDGCSNVCLKEDGYHSSFHVPKHVAHKVPGHEYIGVTPDNKLFKDGNYHLSPIEEMVYHLVEIQDDSSDYVIPLVKDVYETPTLLDHDDYHAPNKHIIEVYEPPVKEYLPPPPSVEHAIHHHPETPHHHDVVHSSYEPPVKQYLPPPTEHHIVEVKEDYHPKVHAELVYEPPKKEYLPPPPTPVPEVHLIHHPDNHLKPKEEYGPPVKDYLPPPPPTPAYSPPPPPKDPIAAYEPPPPAIHPIAAYTPPTPVAVIEPIAPYVPPPHKAVEPIAPYAPPPPHAHPPPPVEASYKAHKDGHHEIQLHPVVPLPEKIATDYKVISGIFYYL